MRLRRPKPAKTACRLGSFSLALMSGIIRERGPPRSNGIQMDLIAGLVNLVVGVFFLFGILWLALVFLGVLVDLLIPPALHLLVLPISLLRISIDFVLARFTGLDGTGLSRTQIILITIGTTGITAGIAALYGAALSSIISFGGLGAFYGFFAALSANLDRRF